MRRLVPPPLAIPPLVRSAMAQQQVRTGVALGAANSVEEAFPDEYADDAAAAAGGIPINGVYRNGDHLLVRVA